MDPEIDFAAIMDQFDTLFIGRRTFELMIQSAKGLMPGMRTFVFSRTLPQAAHPDVTIVAEKPEELVTRLRAMPGKDIWLFGGANLFSTLAEAKLVDTVELAIMPVLLGQGIPVVSRPAKLKLTGQRTYKRTGIVVLEYAMHRA